MTEQTPAPQLDHAAQADESRWLDADGHPIDEEDRGLVYDVRTLVNRRAALGLFGGIGIASLLAACTPTATTATPTATGSATATPSPTATAEASGPITEVPDETGGPTRATGRTG